MIVINGYFFLFNYFQGKSAEANDLSGKIREEAEARKARLKQIEDFFTDPVVIIFFILSLRVSLSLSLSLSLSYSFVLKSICRTD